MRNKKVEAIVTKVCTVVVNLIFVYFSDDNASARVNYIHLGRDKFLYSRFC